MIEMGILQDDLVIVKKQNSAQNGQVVVAMIDEGATVKRFYKKDNQIELRPENETMESIFTNDCEILGRVIGLHRDIY